MYLENRLISICTFLFNSVCSMFCTFPETGAKIEMEIDSESVLYGKSRQSFRWHEMALAFQNDRAICFSLCFRLF